jgi:hypothetical protein
MTVEIQQPVRIESAAPPDHAEAVADAFKGAGLDVEVEAVIETRGAVDQLLPWIVQVGIKDTIEGFFLALGAAAFKVFVHDVWKARHGAGNGKGQIDIGDSEATHVLLPNSLPDEAIDALGELDWSEKRGDLLVWDIERREWHDPTKRG